MRGGRPCCLQAHIIAALLAFRLTLALFLSSLLLPCLFADFGLPLAFPCKVGFHLIGFSEDAIHIIRCNFQTSGFFFQGSICLFPLRDFFGQFFFPFFQGFQRWQLSIVFFPEIFHGFCIGIQFLGMLCTEFFLKNRLRKLLLSKFCLLQLLLFHCSQIQVAQDALHHHL